MVQRDPKNPDGWFLRAQAGLALGDVVAAQADMQQAIALAPKDWTTRPDVARFLTRLNQVFAPQNPQWFPALRRETRYKSKVTLRINFRGSMMRKAFFVPSG